VNTSAYIDHFPENQRQRVCEILAFTTREYLAFIATEEAMDFPPFLHTAKIMQSLCYIEERLAALAATDAGPQTGFAEEQAVNGSE
jgi:hypothetical protein